MNQSSTLAADVVALIEPLRAVPDKSLLVLDFDGTLAPIVADPATAMAADGVVEALEALSQNYLMVAVVSGRPVDFLSEQLPPSVYLSGLYGLESSEAAVRSTNPQAEQWQPVIQEAVERSEAACGPGTALEGMDVEPKGLSLTLHARRRPNLEADVVDFARKLGLEIGLDVRCAKLSVEIHPPVPANKGTVLRSLVEKSGATRVMMVGDDLGDIAAFEAIEQMALDAEIAVAVRIGVAGDEMPAVLAHSVQAIVAGPDEVVELMRELL